MAFDWVTVAAQVVNFLILIWLLKRFLYRPILDGIDARESDIAARKDAADQAKAKAEAAAAAHRQAVEHVEAEKSAVLQSARDAAEAERQRLQHEAQQSVAAEQDNWSKQMLDMRKAYATQLQATGSGALVSLARKALHDLAGAEPEVLIAQHLAAHLADLKGELQGASNRAEAAVAITSAPLPEDCRRHLTEAFRSVVADVPLTFETDADQSPGVVLQFGGGRINWTIDAYLDRLDAALTADMTGHDRPRMAAAQ